MPTPKKPANPSRSETVTVRLNPRIHYLATLAARSHQRTLSSFIEWAVTRALTPSLMDEREANVTAPLGPVEPKPLWGLEFWDVSEADRAFKLASRPDLQSFDEQMFFKLFLTHMELTKKAASLKNFREFYQAVYKDGKKTASSEGDE